MKIKRASGEIFSAYKYKRPKLESSRHSWNYATCFLDKKEIQFWYDIATFCAYYFRQHNQWYRAPFLGKWDKQQLCYRKNIGEENLEFDEHLKTMI